MAFSIGTVTEFDDALSILDPAVLTAAKAVRLGAKKGAFWNALRSPSQGIAQRVFHIYGRSFTTRSGAIGGTAWDASATTGLTVSAALANVITKGHILKVDSEFVVVKSVDRTANTIAVFARGAGGTTAATHAIAASAMCIGHAGNDTDLKSVESFSESSNKYENYAQTIFEAVDTTLGEQLYGRKGLDGNPIALLRAEAMNRVASYLASTAIFGLKQAGTATIPAMTAGLLQQLSDTAGVSSTRNVNRANFASAAFTEANWMNALDGAFKYGNPDTIVCSPSRKKQFNAFNTGIIKTDRTDKAAGYEITAYEFQGKSLSFIVDEDMPADRIAVVTLDKCQKGWMDGDVLRYVEEPSASSREKRETLQGTFALIIDGVGYDHLDIYGIGA